MTLKNLELKNFYDSTDNVYRDFFNKVLTESTECFRFGGIFNSKNFAGCAEGMQEFIDNNGKMKIILVPEFSDTDIDAMKKGIKNDKDIIIQNWIGEISEIKDKFTEDHVQALAWLLKEKFLEIKIVIATDASGKILSSSEVKKIGYLDRKLGVYRDGENEGIVSFSGDIDYDEKIFGDWYRFDVYRYWNKIEKDRVNEHYRYFDDLWNNKSPKLESFSIKTIELPEAIEQEIIKKSPKNKSDIKLSKPIKLFDYQEEAISKWKENKFRGIFEMATGTGKTFTAICGITELEKNVGPLGVVIAVPTITLIQQWKSELKKWDYNVIEPSQTNPSWQVDFERECKSIKNKIRKKSSILILAYGTYAKKEFLEKLEKINQKWNVPLLLIADEVHNAGAPKSQLGLVEDYRYRIGLSATIERYFDEIGTQKIREYFGENAITYTLGEAINDKRLVEYYYYPKYVELDPDELDEYRKISQDIAILWTKIQKLKKQHKNSFNDEDKMFRKQLARSDIIKNARQKIPAFKELIDKNPEIKHTFVFSSGKQIIPLQKILNNRFPRPITNRKITEKSPKTYPERVKILQGLADEKYQVVLGIKILDEGIDVPEARNCYILESTGNPKQFIQRRGRVLRIFDGQYKDGSKKEFATINDFLVMPELADDATESEIQLHTKYIANQLKRQEEMAKIAKNSEFCLHEINTIKAKFGLKEI